MRNSSYGRLAGKEEAEAIITLAQQFKKNLNGKSFLICFGSKTLRFLEVSFSTGNFSHLAGIDKHNCRIKPHEVYALATAGNLKPEDLGYSIAPKFKMKTIAAKFLNEFGSTATHVSAVNKRRSKVNAEIWISGSKAGFAIGAIHIGSTKSGSVTFAPTSLQLLSDVELQEKSVGKVEPIAIILSRRSKEMSYSVIEFVDEKIVLVQEVVPLHGQLPQRAVKLVHIAIEQTAVALLGIQEIADALGRVRGNLEVPILGLLDL